MDGDVLYLPSEIIRDILKRLPVKSLIRFQCVCKDWKNIIKGQSFIAEHLHLSSDQNPSLLFDFCGGSSPFPWSVYLLDCGLQFRGVQRAPSINSLKGAGIIGSCNGLLCLAIHESVQSPPLLALWNPATTAVRHVRKNRTDYFDLLDECVTGFGFSPVVDDYKIVRAYSVVCEAVSRVEVFSLSRGTWKEIDIGNLKGVKLDSETIMQTVSANGAIFWSGDKIGAEEERKVYNIESEGDEDYREEYGEDAGIEVIVSFDIANEVFTVIPKPDLDYNANEKLTVYENKLAILCDIREDDGETHYLIDLWVLDEGTCASGETWSWTKRYTSSPFSCSLESITIWRNEIVCKPNSGEDNDGGRKHALYLMNVTTNEVKRFTIPCFRFTIDNYVESLASLGNNGNNYTEEP